MLHAISPDDIKVKEPGGQEPGKTHTSLLLDQHGDFLAFGTKAREVRVLSSSVCVVSRARRRPSKSVAKLSLRYMSP